MMEAETVPETLNYVIPTCMIARDSFIASRKIQTWNDMLFGKKPDHKKANHCANR
jgi:hypothetical protein